MSLLSRVLVGLVAVVAVDMRAADPEVQLQHNLYQPPVQSAPDEALAFWDRFQIAFNRSVDDAFLDRFHPLTVMNWKIRVAEADSDLFRKHSSSDARHAVADSAVYGFREATADAPGMMSLEERNGFLADVLRNTVGNVEEEALAPLNPAYRPLEHLWWTGLLEKSEVLWGLRPLRTNPYAFLSLCIRDGDHLLLLGHLRYHYSHFAEHNFEFALSLPLVGDFFLDVGTSCELGRHEEHERIVLKLFREFQGGGILHVGLEMQGPPTLFAGISFPL